ncbi:histone-lysine N-methyltransferase SETMAR-like [Tachypleus tridentatus]|uniref:histone-lysine N-methyltransferase SETMAR-like n=1 Tax=Tachypleus tridentatus TaxID=6853 RepID=UPI003FD2B0E2
MEVSEEHIRHIIFYKPRKGKHATEAIQSILKIYGSDILKVMKCQRWFNKFKTRDGSLTDAAHTGHHYEFDNDLLLATLEEDCAVTVEELVQKLNSSPSTVYRHLQQLGRVSKLGKWVPHELSADNLRGGVDICTSLHSHELQYFF